MKQGRNEAVPGQLASGQTLRFGPFFSGFWADECHSDNSKLARRVAARVVAAIDNAIVHLSRHGATAVRLAGGANAVVAGIGNGAGITVANLPCVTAPGKKLIANRWIFKQIVVALRYDKFGE